MIYYHPGKPGEVSHEAARRKAADVLTNPFIPARLIRDMSDTAWQRNDRRPLCAPGVMMSWLTAAAIREATQGEG